MVTRVLAAMLGSTLLLGGSLRAQSAAPPRALQSSDSAHAPAPLFTLRDAAVAAAFAGATVALFPVDERVAKHLQNPGAQANRFFKDASNGVELIASPGAFVIGGTLYAVGRLGHHDRVADLGWHGTEAVLVAQGVTGVLKGALGRARPYASADTIPRDFKFGGGFSSDDRRSFPSGHATTAFAAAAAVTSEARRWWPEQWWSTWLVGPAMYGGATMVGLSRMYHNKHWASDVALGAAIGTFSGMKVVQYSHAHPRNRVDRIMLHTALAPDGRGGAMLGWSIATP